MLRRTLYWRVFKAADYYDVILMLFGTIGAAINGLVLPVTIIVQCGIYDKYASSQASNSSAGSYSASKQALLQIYIAIVGFAAGYLQLSCWVCTGDRQARRLRLQYVHSILKQDVSYFERDNSSAQVINDVSRNIMQAQEAIGEKLGNIIHFNFAFVGCCLVGVILIWRLVLVTLPFIPLLVVPGILYGKVVSSHSSKKQGAYAAAGTIAKQAISSIRVVYAFTGEKKTLELYSRSLDKVVKLEIAQGLAKGLAMGSGEIASVSWAFIMWYGSKMVAQGHGNGAQVLFVGVAFTFGSLALGRAIEYMNALSEGHIALERILQIIERTPSIDVDNINGKELPSLEGRIHLRHVTFSYPSRPQVAVLEDFNLEIPAGKTTALVGKSGSGKSTVIALLERFYDPLAGEVLLDGVDIRSLKLKWFRNQIGLVSQEPTLFSTSMKENILLGKENATMDEVIAAAMKANAHDFIMALPDGYETQVGELGSQMSGGQKQRIAIARAIIRNPSIMLLDEATSALDNESEKAVQAALDQACLNLTTVTIAHRLNSIKNADYIAVMDSGKVVEFGRQQDLVSKGETGLYAAILQNWKRKDTMTDLVNVENPARSTGELEKLLQPQAPLVKEENQRQNVSVTSEALATKHNSLTFMRLLYFNKPEWREGGFGLVCAVVSGFLCLVSPIVTGVMASAFYTQSKHELKKTIEIASAVCIGSAIAFFICSIIHHYCFGVMGAFLTQRVRERMLAKILQSEVEWFDREENSSGAICSRLASDADMVRSLVGDRISLLVQVSTKVVLGIAAGCVLSWKLAIVVTLVQPLNVFSYYIRLRNLKGHARRAALAQQKVSQIAHDALSQQRTVTAYCLQDTILRLLKSRLETLSAKAWVVSQVAGITHGIGVFVQYSCYGLCIWYGGQLIAQQKITFKDFLITYSILVYIGRSLAETLLLTPDVASGMAVAKLVFETIDRKTKIHAEEGEPGGHLHLGPLEGKVEFEDISFAYPSRNILVLRSFSLRVEAGQTVALVGKSGSGKSTVIALLERFYDPVQGRIAVDGLDIKQWHLQSLRKQMGLVNQEPTLFATSIRDNIAYGKESATDAEIVEAACVANAHSFISALPEGYSTFAGEGGAQLSGGQKQRIAIARAVLRNPAILLLDEATSALDGESERAVQEAVDKIMVARTTIVVAHRLSTIQNADVIAVVEDGAISEKGSHGELLSQGKQGAYYSLVHSQLDM